ncbi:MAG: DNA translocase FtsK [Acidiferrobacteraceae bacterium]
MGHVSYKKERLPLAPPLVRLVREVGLYLFGAAALYLLLALSTYHAGDPSWSHVGAPGGVRNVGGRAGAWIADLLYVAFGYVAFLFPAMLSYAAWRMLRVRAAPPGERRAQLLGWIGFVLTLLGGCGLADLAVYHNPLRLPFSAGGLLGHLVGGMLSGAFSAVGATIFLLAVFLSGVTLFTRLSWLALMDRTGAFIFAAASWIRDEAGTTYDRIYGRKARQQRRETVAKERRVIAAQPPVRIEPVVRPIQGERIERERQAPLFKTPLARGELPPLSLLDEPGERKHQLSDDALKQMSNQLVSKLRDFHIEVTVTGMLPGPIITRFEIDPAPGIKASQITNLARDLARAMSVVSLRVVENIPGKSVVGIEIPNEHRETVYLYECLSSRSYEETEGLALALGKDIAGSPVVTDLTRMPHLLIAGTTGSGKSVCINALILSLLYKYTPEQCRLIMIDPKMLELAAYDGIPHLLAPVVTEMKQSAQALRWCIFEMERRYRLMSHLGVRNLGGYNRKVLEALNAGRPILDPNPGPGTEPASLRPLPFIVILIDELADMMMVVGKKVEELITRLAQKARAAGLHLVLATQRPSVDVITGLIKANIPTRIAFQMSARVDSRTVLDQMGAEQLLGQGDMLFLQAGSGVPMRVHGAFVADHEVHKVAEFLKQQGTPEYNERILSGEPEEGAESVFIPGDEMPTGEADPLYDQALRIVTESRKASISGVQRRLRIGYNRAARLIEEMERVGVVGPLQTNGSREVLAPPAPED